MSPDTDPDKSIAESQKTLRRIIDVWVHSVRDPEPAIRLFTILVTIAAFGSVVLFLIALLHAFANVRLGQPIQLQSYAYCLLAEFLVVMAGSIPLTFTLTSRAEAATLDAQFSTVARKSPVLRRSRKTG